MWLQFTPLTTISLVFPVLNLLLALYLLQRASKDRAWAFMFVATCAWAWLGVAAFVASSTSFFSFWWTPHGHVNSLQLLLIGAMAVVDWAEIGFAYAFMGAFRRREARWVLGAGTLFYLVVDPWVKLTHASEAPVVQAAYYVSLAFQLWLVFVFIRRARAMTPEQPLRPWLRRPATVRQRGLVAFAYLFFFGFVVNLLSIYSNLLAEGLFVLFLLLGPIYVVLFIVLYITYTDRETGFQVKLAGLTALMMLTTSGILTAVTGDVQAVSATFNEDRGYEAAETLGFVPAGTDGYRVSHAPAAHVAEAGVPCPAAEAFTPCPVRLPFAFPFFGTPYDTLYPSRAGVVGIGAPGTSGEAIGIWSDVFLWVTNYRLFYDATPKIAVNLGVPGDLAAARLLVDTTAAYARLTWAFEPVDGPAYRIQVMLHPDGRVEMTYGGVPPEAFRGVRGLKPPGALAVPPPLRPFAALAAAGPVLVQDYSFALRRYIHRLVVAAPVFVLVGGFCFFVAFLWMLRSGFGRPWQRLRGAILEVERGNHDVRVAVERYDEMGYLGERFNSMIATLGAAERALKAHAEELETRVANRTAELEQALGTVANQADRLQTLNTTRSRFFANLSHEFRTPLTLMLGPLDDLLADADAPHRPTLERMRRNAQRLLRLINQLLDLSKLEAGGFTLQAQRYDLASFLRRMAAAFEGYGQANGIALHTEGLAAPFGHAFDPPKLEQVVLNLLSNAFKFTPAGGAVTVRLQRGRDGAAVIEVEDTGEGIAAEHLPHLFDRFYQVDGTTTRRHEGTGIGLALVRELVALHGGTITARSRPGAGTCMTVVLPAVASMHAGRAEPVSEDSGAAESRELEAAQHASVPPAAADAPAVEAAEAVVLVVEDNADLRAYLRENLAARFTVVEAADGQAGLEQARALVPDLVVSDLMMPRLDGMGLLRALRHDARTSHVPVLLLTAKADVESRVAGFEAGADAYLPKPFNTSELRARIDALVARQQQLREAYRARYSDRVVVLGAEEMTLPEDEVAFLEQLRAEIEAHLDDPAYGVAAMGEAMAMSERQLRRKLGALTGETPGDLLRRMRLERAAQLLQHGAASVKEVAAAVGYRSASHFARQFRDVYGVSPSGYEA